LAEKHKARLTEGDVNIEIFC